MPDQDFPESELRLDAGTFYVFSDGLTEASCSDGSMLGAEGVRRLIDSAAALPLRERVAAVLAEVRQLDLRDDLTLLAASSGVVEE